MPADCMEEWACLHLHDIWTEFGTKQKNITLFLSWGFERQELQLIW